MTNRLLNITFSIILVVACTTNKKEHSNEKAISQEYTLPSKISKPIRMCTEVNSLEVYRLNKKELDSLLSYYNNIEKELPELPDSIEFMQPDQLKAAIFRSNIWRKNTLYVSFLEDNKDVNKKIETIASEWEKYADIDFVFGKYANPDISITLNDDGYWSKIGRHSSTSIPSMSLSGVDSEDDIDFKSIVLHEFGHALGLVHEHQRPDAGIPWDTKRVYAYYHDNLGWDKDMTYNNVLFRYDKDQTRGSSYDPLSIMIYAIPKEVLTDPSYSVDWAIDLSKDDKSFIARIY